MKINHMINNQELLTLANHYLIAHPPRHLSEATHAQYEKEFLNIIKNCESINSAVSKICNTNKKSTFFKRKYAVQSILSDQIQDCLVEIQTAIYPSKEEIEKLNFLLNFAKEVEGLGKACPIQDTLPRKSKRQDIRGLPSTWREQLLERMSDSTNYIPALVLAVSGCRPAELKKGIQIVINDNMMVIKIPGAKLGKNKGQRERIIEYRLPSTNKLVSRLREAIQYSGSIEISINNPNSFCSAITYYGRQTFPGRRKAITPYCFRHAFASDIKMSRSDTDDVSRALGHQVDRTKSSYGQAQMGTPGGLAPETISATHNIRHTRTSIKCPDAAIEGLSDSEYT
jgi:integrase